MAGVTIVSSTSIAVSSLPNSISARGNGVYNYDYGSSSYVDITVGFVYSILPITVSAMNDLLQPQSGQFIGEISTGVVYIGGESDYTSNFTATDVNVTYTLNIPTVLPNILYYVRSYIKYFVPNTTTPLYKYGSQLSILASGGLSGGSGYYISADTVGFYDPLQIRDSNEGIERVLTSDSSGLVNWKPVKSLFTFGHYIGERYGGGIVAAVWKEGDDEKVLIVSETDIVSDTPTGPSQIVAWSYGTSATTLIGSSAQSKYNGYLNTAAIIAQSAALGTIYSAAAGAAAYRGGGYEDWYLPSYYELNQVFNNMAIINKVIGLETLSISSNSYWTSTEYSDRTAILLSRWGGWEGSSNSSAYTIENKIAAKSGKVRAVRKESVYTGDGLILNLDATNKKSFSDIDYLNMGTASRWKDMVNGGMTSSYWFTPMAYPVASSGGTTTDILPMLITIGIPTNIKNLSYRQVQDWWIDKVGGISTPVLQNETGPSSMTSVYFNVPTNNSFIRFDCYDGSTIKDPLKAKLNIYVSVRNQGYDGPYNLIKDISDITTTTTRTIPISYYSGKTISIRFTAPNGFYIATDNVGGPALDNIVVRGTSGGYQATGPVYSPYESGFISFNGTGSMTDTTNFTNTFGSYFDIKAPIGNATTATVEIWMRLKDSYQTRMPFAWSRYSIFTGAGGGLGFNTGNSDLYGITPARVQSLGLPEKWAHYVFEMRSDVSYTNNKMYINGNEQVLSQVAGAEEPFYRNFNGGLGRIGGWRSPDNNKLYLFRGDISVVRIYNRALTKDEIMKNYSTEKKRYDIVPSILTNNILTSIDFDNPASYSGDGTVTREVADLSGNSINAQLAISTTTTKPSVVRTNSLYNGKEVVFTGTITTNPSLSWNSTAFETLQNLSVSFWIKFTEHRPSSIIVKWNQTIDDIGPWDIFQHSPTNSSTVISVTLRSTGGRFDQYGSKQIELNKWTHVCVTYDNVTRKLITYIDSAIDIVSSPQSGFSIATGIPGQVSVGRYISSTNLYPYPLKGSIASIQIYNKALTSGEVKNNYDADKIRFDNFSDANKFSSHEINGNPTFSISQNMRLDIGEVLNEKVLKLDTMGYSKWVDKSSLFTRPNNYRYIGELYGGGIIVAMWYYPKTIFNYLIMSLEDVSAGSQWSNVTNLFAGATSEFKGETNQTTILAQGGHSTSAAKLCDNYAAEGFTDWYLPSVFEMNQAFNAAGIVDTVLGSDKLDGTYWTSTEPYNDLGSTNAISYSFAEAGMSLYMPTGIQKSAPKANSYKVRAFRLATNAVSVNVWDETWDETYTPWWMRWRWEDEISSPITFWEMDWAPARYTPTDFNYWRRTNVTTGILDLFSTSGSGPYTLTFKVRGSTVNTFEQVLEFGVCWKGTLSNTGNFGSVTPPTISDNRVVGTGAYSSYTSTIVWPGVPDISYYSAFGYKFEIDVCAYVKTKSGVYYGTRYYYPYNVGIA